MGLGITLWTILPVVEPLKAMISVDMELRTDLKVRSLGSMLWKGIREQLSTYKICPIWLRQKDRFFWANWAFNNNAKPQYCERGAF